MRSPLLRPAGAILIPALLLLGYSAMSPIPSSSAAAGVVGADSIINLVRWEETDGGNGHWYGLLAEEHSALEAESLAATYLWQGDSGYLATMDDSAENAFVFEQVLAGSSAPRGRAVLGGRFGDWSWTWITGEQFCYTNWIGGQPTNLIVLPAVAMVFNGKWTNISLDSQWPFSDRFWAVVEWGPLDTTIEVPVCGNGILECQETCDDGNAVGGDGCSQNCRQEFWPCGLVTPGDVNVSGAVTAADILWAVNFAFKGGPPPEPCVAFADVDCSGAFTSADIIALVNYTFKGGAEPCDPCFSGLATGCEY